MGYKAASSAAMLTGFMNTSLAPCWRKCSMSDGNALPREPLNVLIVSNCERSIGERTRKKKKA